jgi:hypothetical protein
MELLGDLGHLESRFGLFAGSANLDARLIYGLRRTYHRLGNHFGRTRWNSKVMWVMWNLVSVYLEIVLGSVQDRCMDCTEHTIGLGIVLDAHDGTASLVGPWESRLSICR